MDYNHNPKLTTIAKNLRKNMTPEEKHLWYDFLRDYPVRILRQKVIGNYVVDFYCHEAKLVIELDGFQHYEDEGLKKDEIRDAYLRSKGLDVIRIYNRQIKRNFTDVCFYLDEQIKERIATE